MKRHIITDLPIENHKQDLLGRTDFAKNLAKTMTELGEGGSFVISIHGQWGSGKTSVLNMIEESLKGDVKKPIIIKFDPWIISESSQLIPVFLTEMALSMGFKKPNENTRSAPARIFPM
jgi:predicted KAP-like P-loop ATPase